MRNLLLLLLLLSFSICANTQTIRHGVIVGVSDSWLNRSGYPGGGGFGYGEQYGIVDGKWKARISFNAGYQLQFDIKEKYVLDAALLFQSRGVHVFYMPSNISTVDETKRLNSIALNGVFNYRIWKGVKAGLGIEPTYYWKTGYWTNQKKTVFDVPLVAKVGYDFKVMEISLSYKHGINPIVEGVGYTYKAKSRDIQLSVFMPLGKLGL
ncbi:MAG: hypothetical protein LBV43_14795 [Prevotella sp.]|nr:hypothetical protein [Prevotella sp.]